MFTSNSSCISLILLIKAFDYLDCWVYIGIYRSIFYYSNTMEFLGVTIDDKLNFENHIDKICRKVSQQNYGGIKKDAETVKCRQTSTLFCFMDKSTPDKELLKCIGLLMSLWEQRVVKILPTIFKMLVSNTHGPSSLCELLTVRRFTYNLTGTRIVDLPKVAGLKYRSQVTGHRSQFTGYRSQVTGHRSQVAG